MTTTLINSISVDALIAARDAAWQTFLDCARLHKEAADRLLLFGVDLPRLEVAFAGAVYRDLGDKDYRDSIRKEIDRKVWLALFQQTNIDLIMDSETRRKLHEMLHKSQAYRHEKTDLPELTAETLRSTFEQVHADRQDYFEKCVEAVYRRLSWDHKTNRPGRIGDKLIVWGLTHSWQRKYQGDTVSLSHHDAMQDLERVLSVLDGQPLPTYEFGLRSMQRVPYGEWTVVPSAVRPLMDVKVHRNGTTHVRIKNREHVDQMNRIMAKRYPGALSTGEQREADGKRASA